MKHKRKFYSILRMLLAVMRAVKLLILVLCVGCVCVHAQQQNIYSFAHLDFNQGLSHNQVNCIYKDKKGFMWFGTMNGLNRYDGYVFKSYYHREKDSASINDNYILWIAEAPFDKLWIQTRTGYNVYDPVTEKFASHVEKYFTQYGLPQGNLYNILKHGKGYWFLYHDKGIYYYENNKHAVAVKQFAGNDPNIIADVKFDTGNFMWIVYCNGMIEQTDGHTKKNNLSNRYTAKKVWQKQYFV